MTASGRGLPVPRAVRIEERDCQTVIAKYKRERLDFDGRFNPTLKKTKAPPGECGAFRRPIEGGGEAA
jgi:hypothetical protein